LRVKLHHTNHLFMKPLFYFGFVFGILVFSVSALNAQSHDESEPFYLVEMLDKNQFFGRITAETDDYIILQTDNLGDLKIQRDLVKRISVVKQTELVDGKIWPENTQDSRYFWAPNGYGMKKGDGYYQNIWVLFNQASYAFSDRFTFGVGMIPTVLFGLSDLPVWFTPKYSIPIIDNKLNVGVGTIFATVIGQSGGVGLLYATATAGSRHHNVSVGMAYGYTLHEMAKIPVFQLGGMSRVGAKSYLLCESYILTSDQQVAGLFLLGGRQLVRTIGLDYGLGIPFGPDMARLYAFPWLGITVPF
jgi:hypothetical protein